jgi:hypothetical protein
MVREALTHERAEGASQRFPTKHTHKRRDTILGYEMSAYAQIGQGPLRIKVSYLR